MTMTREELAAHNAKLIEEMRTKATADTATLRNTCALYLRERLPGGFSVTPYEQKVWGDQTELRLRVRASDGEEFTLRFYVIQKSNRWGRNSTFEPCISGSEYQRERRTFRPVYEKRKDGSYNYANMLADIERCIEWKRYQTKLHSARVNAMGASGETLKKVRFALTGTHDATGRSIEHDAGDLRVTISSGEYSSGAVRVQVRLRDEYLSAEQAIALIERLNALGCK